jgi:hypothetical protein
LVGKLPLTGTLHTDLRFNSAGIGKITDILQLFAQVVF